MQTAERGFTLIEIMVVVVIIGLLATLVGPTVWEMLGLGQEGVAQAKCKELHDQVMTWKMYKKKFPDSLEDMEAPIRPGQRNFITVEDDPWGNPYQLMREGNIIQVISWGPDGQEATDDDITYPKPKDE